MSVNSEHLRVAAAKRSQDSYERVINALEQMARNNISVNISSVARVAGVSKNYIYKNPDLRARVFEIRDGESERVTEASKDQIILFQQKEIERLGELIDDIREDDVYSKSWRRKFEAAKVENEELRSKLQEARREIAELNRQLRAAYDYSRI